MGIRKIKLTDITGTVTSRLFSNTNGKNNLNLDIHTIAQTADVVYTIDLNGNTLERISDPKTATERFNELSTTI